MMIVWRTPSNTINFTDELLKDKTALKAAIDDAEKEFIEQSKEAFKKLRSDFGIE